MKYSIWQLPASNKNIFRDLKEGANFTLDDYVAVWHGDLAEEVADDHLSCCEALFTQFNAFIPEHFAGHSISVSDVILLETDTENEIYFCSSIGFRKINLK